MDVTPSGRFPIIRAGEHPLRAAVEAWRARGDISPEAPSGDRALAAAQAGAARELIADQERLGVDERTGGTGGLPPVRSSE